MGFAVLPTHDRSSGNREPTTKCSFTEYIASTFLSFGYGEIPTWQYQITMNFSLTIGGF
jgi:hypothetical protein